MYGVKNVVMLEFCLSRQPKMGPLSDNTSAPAQRQPAEEQEDLHYASIHLSLNQEEALYSNIRSAQHHRQNEEEDDVEYSIVNSARSGPG